MSTRGRKKGSSNTTYINDALLSPYYIAINQNSFMVCEGDKESYNVVGYFSNFNSAVRKVAREKLNEDKKTYSSLREYVREWETITNEFTTNIKL